MDISTAIIVVLGLLVFELITSIDNAIINADVLRTMRPQSRKWFLVFGLIIGVFVVRGLLPWIIVWASNPSIGPINAFIASFTGNSDIEGAIKTSSPIILMGAGTYLLLLFLHWIFSEPKRYSMGVERVVAHFHVWYFATASVLLAVIVWFALQQNSALMAFGAVIGSTVFYVSYAFKLNAEDKQRRMRKKKSSDISKIWYLEMLDSTFSVDSVLGAFAFTLSVPLIIIGNGLGALIVRQLTINGVHKVKKFIYLKNGAMYSIFVLGVLMILDSFGYQIPIWLSPVLTFVIVGYFLLRSEKAIEAKKAQAQ